MLNPELVFVSNRLEIRDDASLKRLDRSRWSASGMFAIGNCPAMWAADKLFPEPENPFGAAEIGTAAHKVLEELYKLAPEQRTEAMAMDILRTLEKDYPKEIAAPESAADLMDWRGQVAAKVVGVFGLEDPTKVDVISTEMKLLNEVAGVPMIGFVDRVDRTPSGAESVVDYKSGKVKFPNQWGDNHGDQIRLYAASRRADGKDVAGGSLYYIGAPQRRDVTLHDSDINRVLEDFRGTYDEMKQSAADGSYRTKTSGLCGWCPLSTVCPSAQAEGRNTPKTERAKLGISLGIRTEVFTPAAPVVQTEPKTRTSKKRKRPMHLWNPNEGKMWEATMAVGDSAPPSYSLNANSYVAIAYCGTASLAVELMFKEFDRAKAAGEEPKPPTNAEITAFAETLALVTARAQMQLTGTETVDWGKGINTRIRGALRTMVEITPIPFGGSKADWEQFVNRMVTRIMVVMDAAMGLHVDGITPEPYNPLIKQ